MNLQDSLIAPEKAREELKKYSKEIIQKIKIDDKEFNNLLMELEKTIEFIEKKEYADMIENVKNTALDKEDYEFLALSYKNKCILWTNDIKLKNQQLVKVITTRELLED